MIVILIVRQWKFNSWAYFSTFQDIFSFTGWLNITSFIVHLFVWTIDSLLNIVDKQYLLTFHLYLMLIFIFIYIVFITNLQSTLLGSHCEIDKKYTHVCEEPLETSLGNCNTLVMKSQLNMLLCLWANHKTLVCMRIKRSGFSIHMNVVILKTTIIMISQFFNSTHEYSELEIYLPLYFYPSIFNIY